MASLTLKNIPESLLESLRERAEADRRSLTQEVLHLLESALEHPASGHDADARALRQARNQADAWAALGGRWQSDLEPEAEIDRILSARTRGRDVEL